MNSLLHRPFHARLFAVAVLLAVSAPIPGCTTPSPEKRAEQRAATFGRLPARDQQLALAGQVRAGMSPEAVFVAWGQPTQEFRGRAAGERELLAWVYLRAAPARPTPDFPNYPADYYAARLDFLSAYHRRDGFHNYPGAFASRFYPGAVFYPGPLAGAFSEDQPPVLVRQAVFENGRLARFAEIQERR